MPDKRGAITDSEVIRGGCPDGFWARRNCDNAASMGLCTFSRIEDNRPASVVAPGTASPEQVHPNG